MVLVSDSVQNLTVGSKLEEALGEGIFSKSLGISRSIRLPDFCSATDCVGDYTGHKRKHRVTLSQPSNH